jgi:hypothetical protein
MENEIVAAANELLGFSRTLTPDMVWCGPLDRRVPYRAATLRSRLRPPRSAPPPSQQAEVYDRRPYPPDRQAGEGDPGHQPVQPRAEH